VQTQDGPFQSKAILHRFVVVGRILGKSDPWRGRSAANVVEDKANGRSSKTAKIGHFWDSVILLF
jgi:hypothetical protein